MTDVAAYMPMVYSMASKMHQGALKIRELDELVGDGMEGLVKAGNKFDPERGVNFATFARKYVRGAMIDGVRKQFGRTRRVQLVSLDHVNPDTYCRDFAQDVDPLLELQDIVAHIELSDDIDKACLSAFITGETTGQLSKRLDKPAHYITRRKSAIKKQFIGMKAA